MLYRVTVGDVERTIEIDGDRVLVDGDAHAFDYVAGRGDRPGHLLLGDRSYRIYGSEVESGEWRVEVNGRSYPVTALTERMIRIREMSAASGVDGGAHPLKAPMPGLVVKVEVEVGDEVEAGQGIVIVEAMKMENELSSPGSGTVSAISVAPGDTVEKGQVLVEFE